MWDKVGGGSSKIRFPQRICIEGIFSLCPIHIETLAADGVFPPWAGEVFCMWEEGLGAFFWILFFFPHHLVM